MRYKRTLAASVLFGLMNTTAAEANLPHAVPSTAILLEDETRAASRRYSAQVQEQPDPYVYLENVLTRDALESFAGMPVIGISLESMASPYDDSQARTLMTQIEAASPGWNQRFTDSHIAHIYKTQASSTVTIEERIREVVEEPYAPLMGALRTISHNNLATLPIQPHGRPQDRLCIANLRPVFENEPASFVTQHIMLGAMQCDTNTYPTADLTDHLVFQPGAFVNFALTAQEYGFSLREIESFTAYSQSYSFEAGAGNFMAYYMMLKGYDDLSRIPDEIKTMGNALVDFDDQIEWMTQEEKEINLPIFATQGSGLEAAWAYMKMLHDVQTNPEANYSFDFGQTLEDIIHNSTVTPAAAKQPRLVPHS